MSAARVVISLNKSGFGSVSINGLDISDNVSALQLSARCRHSPKLWLELTADVEITSDADLVSSPEERDRAALAPTILESSRT